MVKISFSVYAHCHEYGDLKMVVTKEKSGWERRISMCCAKKTSKKEMKAVERATN